MPNLIELTRQSIDVSAPCIVTDSTDCSYRLTFRQTRTYKTLLVVPPEVIGRICRYIGLTFDPGDIIDLFYDDTDLMSLRSICRDLHAKTTYDTAIRCGELLDELEIYVDYSGLCNLLHLTQNPEFRDRIINLTLRRRTPGHELSWPPDLSTIKPIGGLIPI